MTHLDQINAFADKVGLTPEQRAALQAIVISAALQAPDTPSEQQQDKHLERGTPQ